MSEIQTAARGVTALSNPTPSEPPQTMPEGVDALLWRLSTPQQRQEHQQALTALQSSPSLPGAAHRPQRESQGGQAQSSNRQAQGLEELATRPAWPAVALARSSMRAVAIASEGGLVEQNMLNDALKNFQESFAGAALDTAKFNAMMREAFGESFDIARLDALRRQSLAGDFSWMPTVTWADAGALRDVTGAHGHIRGAYAVGEDTVYIDREVLKKPALLEQVLGEEIGHAIDARINSNDADGDEGHIFTELLRGVTLDAAELQALRAENDHGAIQVDGRLAAVEFDDGGGGDSSSSSSSESSCSSSESSCSSQGSSESSGSSEPSENSHSSGSSASSGSSILSVGSTESSSSGADGDAGGDTVAFGAVNLTAIGVTTGMAAAAAAVAAAAAQDAASSEESKGTDDVEEGAAEARAAKAAEQAAGSEETGAISRISAAMGETFSAVALFVGSAASSIMVAIGGTLSAAVSALGQGVARAAAALGQGVSSVLSLAGIDSKEAPSLDGRMLAGLWPADAGSKQWARLNGLEASEGCRRFHNLKQDCGGRPRDNFSVNPATGDVFNPLGEHMGNLHDWKPK